MKESSMGESSMEESSMDILAPSIARVRLASLRGMLRLESAGMKSRGGALRPKIAAEFGLSPRAAFADYIKAVEARMQELS